jgi:hypothetical protein
MEKISCLWFWFERNRRNSMCFEIFSQRIQKWGHLKLSQGDRIFVEY